MNCRVCGLTLVGSDTDTCIYCKQETLNNDPNKTEETQDINWEELLKDIK